MKHCECANYLSLDCEKGMCALDKTIVPLTVKAATPALVLRKVSCAKTAPTSPMRINTELAIVPVLRRKTGRMPSTVLSAASIISSAERKKTRQVKGVTV